MKQGIAAVFQPKVLVPVALIAVIVLSVIAWKSSPASAPFFGHKSSADILPDVHGTVAKLPRRSAQHPAVKLADQSQPVPTNSWLSSLALGENNAAAYLYPWTYQPTKTGATVSYPDVKTNGQTVMAEHTPDVTLDFGADDYQIASYDDLSAQINYEKSGQVVASSRLIQGAPYIFLTIKPRQHLTLRGGQYSSAHDGTVIKVGDKRYGVWHDNAISAAQTSNDLTLSADGSDGHVTLITLPSSLDETAAFQSAPHQVVETKVTYSVSGDQTTTHYQLATTDHQPTLFGLLPYQSSGKSSTASLGTIDTLPGTQAVRKGSSFSYTLRGAMPDDTLISSKLDDTKRQQIITQLQKDIAATTFNATDSYGAGKQLYRAANLLELTHELNQNDLAKQIQEKLKGQLDTWLDPGGQRSDKYFYYDPAVHGLVGVQPSFGSEQFNDHQFHYGYFIYAASILAKYDDGFKKQSEPMVTALIRDVDSPDETEDFPKLRTYDSYVGHSWADGYGDTLDGNNQESSSEAVDSAYAIYQWGKVTGNQKLQNFAQWLYQNQAATTLADWTNINKNGSSFTGYKPSIVSQVWQGKLDYATFFSPQASAKLGIQLIPMSPAQLYLARDTNRIKTNLAQVHDQSALTDYLLMYRALAEPDQAAKSLAHFDQTKIDSADSLSYLMAWVYGRQ